MLPLTLAALLSAFNALDIAAPGTLVDLGGYRLHVHCTGHGLPTVVIENGFDEVSTDWVAVQSQVSRITRICSYDRAGYAWSDPGPRPRSFAQINLELREALRRLKESPPWVLVGHSFGGAVARQFALRYPREVVGMVLAESVEEGQRYVFRGTAIPLRSGATGRTIAPPHLALSAADRATPENTAASERTWSAEYFARWFSHPQAGSLGALPLVVLTRARGGYSDDLDIGASFLEAERRDRQARLARLSTRGEQRIVSAGHDLQAEAPDVVSRAIEDVVAAARH
jgi:pimeloyl-ACP methyl ester carboxylesterase